MKQSTKYHPNLSRVDLGHDSLRHYKQLAPLTRVPYYYLFYFILIIINMYDEEEFLSIVILENVNVGFEKTFHINNLKLKIRLSLNGEL